MPDDSVTIKLFKPIAAHGETVAELTLRRPTVAEVRQHGQPYIMTGSAGGGMKADYVSCAALISAICAIPPSSVDQLDSADFDELAMRLVGFTKRAPVAASESGSAPKS